MSPLLAVPLLLLSGTPSAAEPVGIGTATNFTLTTEGGNINIYFGGSDAAYSHLLFLNAPRIAGPFFPTRLTPIGQMVELGPFEAGAALTFRLRVLDTGEDFFTGAAGLNPDGLAHALSRVWSPTASIPTAGVLIGFEDLFGGGDLDYNDFQFVVGNVRLVDHAPIPEPSTLFMLGSVAVGAAGRAWVRRRRREHEDGARKHS